MKKNVDQPIWRNLTIGAPDAEADKDLLDNCYVDNGCLTTIRDVANHASIVLGRTGHGKSAVLLKLHSEENNAVALRPMELAFRFVENSTVIRFFEDAGVNLNLFYRLLWRHVLVSEFIKLKFQLTDQSAFSRWVDNFVAKFDKNSAKAKSLAYLRKWGENFWEDTEVRLTEVTRRIESELSSSLEGSAAAIKLKAGGVERLTDAERAEVVSRGSAIVNKIQIGELNNLVKILAEEVFDDPQKKHYITIDGLDEEWVSSTTKYRLIRSLVEEIRTFRNDLRNAKVVVALRQDLLERVFEVTRDGGFQEEKYETYYARLDWSRADLLELLRLRVNEVFTRRYTSVAIGLDDVFPKARGGSSPYEYIFERTMARPRDVIAFGNECFNVAIGRSRVSWRAIFDAELQYSRKRRNALMDEWMNTLPSVRAVLDVLRDMPETFSRSLLREDAVENVVIQLATFDAEDDLIRLCKKLYEPKSTTTMGQVVSELLRVLYHIGAIGVKFSSESPYIWSFQGQKTISISEAKRVMSIKVHKMLWRGLEIRTGDKYRIVTGLDDD